MNNLKDRLITESDKSWNLSDEQMLAIYGALCFVDAYCGFDELADVLNIDKNDLGDLEEEFGNALKPAGIFNREDFKDLKSQGHISGLVSKIAK